MAKLAAGASLELAEGVRDVHLVSVGARRDHCVIGIADGDYSRAERDVCAIEPVGVAGAVEALVT